MLLLMAMKTGQLAGVAVPVSFFGCQNGAKRVCV